MWGKGNPGALLVGMQTGEATLENSWNFLRKLKMELPFDPAIPLLGLYPKSPETPVQKNLCTPMFTAAQFTIAKCWKQSKCPSANEWIKKLWYRRTKMVEDMDALHLLAQTELTESPAARKSDTK